MKQKIEVGQVWHEERSAREYLLTYYDGNIIHLGNPRVQWNPEGLIEHFTLYRNADGTLASPETINTEKADTKLSEVDELSERVEAELEQAYERMEDMWEYYTEEVPDQYHEWFDSEGKAIRGGE